MSVKNRLLNKKNDCFTFKDLKCIFKEMKLEELKRMINRLVKEEFLIFEQDFYYIKDNLKIGIIDIKLAGYGFFKDDNEEIFISEYDRLDALSGDKVLVHVDKMGRRLKEGHVVKVLERKNKTLVGTFFYKGNIPKFIPDKFDLRNFNIIVDKAGLYNLSNNQKVVVEINKYKHDMLFVKVIEVLGNIYDIGIDVLSIIKEKNIPDKFDYKVLKEANSLNLNLDDIGNRLDLRDMNIFTIDGADAKDFDDAVSISYKDGIYNLGVHIADVSYYVKENGLIDKEAYNRGTSIYLVDRVIPMLPEKLSNNLCSLMPFCDRLALSCFMKIDKNGVVKDYSINESIIRSKKRYTYDLVNKIILEGYDDEYKKDILLMNELSKILINKKNDRGAIDFLENEAKFILDENKMPIDIIKLERKDSEKLIESFMIETNRVIATFINNLELPFLNRVHENPDIDKINEFLLEVKKLGYNKEIRGEITPKDCKEILEYFNDNMAISDRLLRAMAKAKYDVNNYGHFGLALDNYCHFTSPIRRYPDLVVHRMVKDYLIYNRINRIPYWEENLNEIANSTSNKERKAIELEREVLAMEKALYMEKYIGNIYVGRVSGIINNGFFVELDNTCEGFVYDEISKKNIGDFVKIKVLSASKEKRQIDFIEVKDDCL